MKKLIWDNMNIAKKKVFHVMFLYSKDNIRKAWEKQNGKADFFKVKSAENDIFKFRTEMKNKGVHRISYLIEIADCDLLDCTMELRKPNSRKKLDEKLSGLFEEFAFKCKFKA